MSQTAVSFAVECVKKIKSHAPVNTSTGVSIASEDIDPFHRLVFSDQ